MSAVGEDELGQRAIAALGERGVNTSCVQIDRHPTGQVLVELDAAGIADYRFAPDSAWDHLSWTEAMQHLAEDCDAVCFGTLGQRSEGSRATIRKFVEATSEGTLRILDVNLRPPFVDDHVIRDSLVLANFLKLNDEELPLLARLCGATGSSLEVMKIIADRYQLDGVALTRGAEGAAPDQPQPRVRTARNRGAGRRHGWRGRCIHGLNGPWASRREKHRRDRQRCDRDGVIRLLASWRHDAFPSATAIG